MNTFPVAQQFDHPPTVPIVAYSQTSWISALLGTLLVGSITHWLLTSFDYPILSVPELLWNFFVWLMPSRLILGLRPGLSASDANSTTSSGLASSEHAAKSGILRDVFKFNPSQKTARSKAAPSAPAGLGNWDNSCYQNSVLQALASVQSLQGFYKQLDRLNTQLPKDTTLSALGSVIADLNNESNRGQKMWTPLKLKSMSSWQQQDAQEYFSKIMDELEKDTVAAVRRSCFTDKQNDVASIALPIWETDESKRDRKSLPAHESLVPGPTQLERLTSPLDGLLAQRVGCTRCGYVEGLSMIPFNCITLPIGRDWGYELGACLDEFTAVEFIDGVECSKCTLLQARHHLRQQSERLATEPEEQDDDLPTQEELNAYKAQLDERLEAISEALQDDDFSDRTLLERCKIPNNRKICSIKSKQCMIMRAPQCLVMHINRSLFDEATGAQLKNYADVDYRAGIDINPWCVGKRVKVDLTDGICASEEWEMDPTKSMAAHSEFIRPTFDRRYQLSAVITHFGRHENGHYVAYRKVPGHVSPSSNLSRDAQDEKVEMASNPNLEQWWRLSDEDVTPVTEEEALNQGGVFMLFYERVEAEAHNTKGPQAAAETETEHIVEAAASTPPLVIMEQLPVNLSDQREAQVADSPVSAKNEESSSVAASHGSPVRPTSPASRSSPTAILVEHSTMLASTKEDVEEMGRPVRETKAKVVQETKTKAVQETSSSSPAKKALSPTTMRTAGIRERGSDDIDPFKSNSMRDSDKNLESTAPQEAIVKMVAAKKHVPIVKKRTATFKRPQSDRFKCLKTNWRKPKGIDSAVRRRFKGRAPMPSIGYGSNRKTRHMMPSGHKAFLVHNSRDVDLLLMHNQTFAAEISHAVSSRKRVDILAKAKALGVKVTNAKAKVTIES